MYQSFFPVSSETLVFIGAGATKALGMPQTSDQTDVFRALSNAKSAIEVKKELSEYLFSTDLEKIIHFLDLLYGTEKSILEVSDKDIENAKFLYRVYDKKLLKKRVLELRSEYDWNAAKKILKICPKPINKNCDNLIFDVYSIIDRKLLSGQSIKVSEDGVEEILPPSRLQAARNFLILFVNILFASCWYKIIKTDGPKDFEKYQKFVNSFDRYMQKESKLFYSNKYSVQDRNFYLFSTSFVSFNFEMIFPWLFMMSHRELNKKEMPLFDGVRPLKLWLDYGVEHRGRKIDFDGNVIPTLEFTESVASRENEDGCAHIGTELNRAGKFYFAHGSSNWRECPVCGRMTFCFGYNDEKWKYKSNQLITPFPIPLFEPIDEKSLTSKELEWRKSLHYDSLQCMHCGSETKALDAPMIMQTMLKTTPTSFLEEIQRNVKVALSNARHIVLLGYRLPPDDTIWYEAFAEAVKGREKGQEAYCSVVVGYEGNCEWLSGKELEKYVEKYVKYDNVEAYGVSAIKNAWAIFGKENVRAWTGGIPQVFGNCTEFDVKGVFYPEKFVNWKGTRLE